MIGIGSLQIMLDRGKELDWFSSQEIIILTVVAVIAISFLIVWELTDDHPIVDLSLLNRVTSRLAACASALPICSISAPLFYCRSFARGVRLYRNVGRSGVSASRYYSGNFVADYRTLRA